MTRPCANFRMTSSGSDFTSLRSLLTDYRFSATQGESSAETRARFEQSTGQWASGGLKEARLAAS